MAKSKISLPTVKEKDLGRPLTVKVPIIAEDYRAVCGLINLYRHVARKVAASLCAVESAKAQVTITSGAFLKLEKGNVVEGQKILELCFPGERSNALENKICAALAEFRELQKLAVSEREDAYQNLLLKKVSDAGLAEHTKRLKELADTVLGMKVQVASSDWGSDLIQECRRSVYSRWMAKDPVRPIRNRTRVLTGDGFPTQFNFSPVPIKFCDTCRGNIKFGTSQSEEKDESGKLKTVTKHLIGIRLIKEVPFVFKILKCEPRVWHIVKGLACGERVPAGASINLDKKGRLWLRLGYYERIKSAEVDADKTLEVYLDDEGWCARVMNGETLLDQIRRDEFKIDAAIATLDRYTKQREKIEMELISSTRVRRGHEAIKARSNAVSSARARMIEMWNHTWARSFLHTATAYRCGRILFHQPEAKEAVVDGKTVKISGIRFRSWPFSDLLTKIEYKAELLGVKCDSHVEEAVVI